MRRDVAGRGLGGPFLAELTTPHVLHQVRVAGLLDDLLGGLALHRLRGGSGERRFLLDLDAERVERVVEVHPRPAHALEEIADLPEPIRYVLDPEVLGLEPPVFDLVPHERRRHGGAGLGSQAIRGGDVRARAVHVVVDEDVTIPVGHFPRHRDAIRVGVADHVSARADESARLLVRVPARFERHVDLESRGATRLRERRQTELIEEDLDVPSDREDVLVGVRRERVEVEEQVVRVGDVGAPRVERMELDAAEVRDEQQAGGVGDRHVVDQALLAVVAGDRAAPDPVGNVRGRRLLVEEGPLDAVGHPLHRERAPDEVREDQLGGVEVVRDEVALGVALGRPEDLVEVREAELAALDLEPPRVAVLPRVERARELDRERRTAGGLLPRGHDSMLAVVGCAA